MGEIYTLRRLTAVVGLTYEDIDDWEYVKSKANSIQRKAMIQELLDIDRRIKDREITR